MEPIGGKEENEILGKTVVKSHGKKLHRKFRLRWEDNIHMGRKYL
jgi:hypothetical protein